MHSTILGEGPQYQWRRKLGRGGATRSFTAGHRSSIRAAVVWWEGARIRCLVDLYSPPVRRIPPGYPGNGSHITVPLTVSRQPIHDGGRVLSATGSRAHQEERPIPPSAAQLSGGGGVSSVSFDVAAVARWPRHPPPWGPCKQLVRRNSRIEQRGPRAQDYKRSYGLPGFFAFPGGSPATAAGRAVSFPTATVDTVGAWWNLSDRRLRFPGDSGAECPDVCRVFLLPKSCISFIFFRLLHARARQKWTAWGLPPR